MGLIVGEDSLSKILNQVKIDGKSIKLLRTADPDGDLLVPLAGSEYEGKIEFREYFRGDGSQGVHMRQDPPPATTEYREPGGTYHPDPTHFDIYQRPNQAAPEEPFRTPFPEWTAEHRLEGVSWVYVKLIQPDYGNDIDKRFWTRPPNIEFLIEGLQITWPGQTTPVATENAAAIRYWWETVRRGRDPALIDAASFAAAYALCNQDVDATNGGVNPLPAQYSDWPVISKRYTVNGVISAEDNIDQVEDQLDAAWAGEVIESGGKLYFRPGVERTAVLEITDADIIAPPIARPWPSLQERITSVTGEIPQSTQHDYSPLKVPEIPDVLPPDVLDKAGSKRAEHIVLSFVNDPLAAGRLLSIILRRGQERLVLDLQVRPGNNFEFVGLIPTDRVLVTNSEYGLVSQRMIVERIAVRSDGRAELTLREDIDGTYNDDLIIPALPERIIRLPDNSTVPNIEGFNSDEIAAVSNDGTVVIYLLASWTGTATLETEVQIRKKTPQDNWESVITASNNARFPGVIAGETYELQARHWNRSGVAGDWSALIENTVDGDLTPPSPVHDEDVIAIPTGFHLIWENPDDPDFGSACIFMGINNSLAAATLVATVDADYYQSTGLAAGSRIYLWIRAKDRSGNLSAAVGPIVVTPEPLAEGSTLHVLSVTPPNNNFGFNDDVALNEKTGQIYDKINGAWVERTVDIAAPQGLTAIITGLFLGRLESGGFHTYNLEVSSTDLDTGYITEIDVGSAPTALNAADSIWGQSEDLFSGDAPHNLFHLELPALAPTTAIRARYRGNLGHGGRWGYAYIGFTGKPLVSLTSEHLEVGENEGVSVFCWIANATEATLSEIGGAFSHDIPLNAMGNFFGPVVVNPQSPSSRFKISATNPDGTTSIVISIGVFTRPEPESTNVEITRFTADQHSIEAGGQATLVWETNNATSVRLGIVGGSGSDVSLDGSLLVTPNATTTYRIIAEGEGGPVSQDFTIVVGDGPAFPRISSFAPDIFNLSPEQTTTVRWSGVNGVSGRITGPELDRALTAAELLQGSIIVGPFAVGTYEYELTLNGAVGTTPDTESFSILVAAALPTIDSFTLDRDEVESGELAVLRWETTGATFVTINGIMYPVDGFLEFYPTSTSFNNFTIRATNDEGYVEQTLTLDVLQPSGPNDPRIVSFIITPLSIESGQSIIIDWETVNALRIDLAYAPVGETIYSRYNDIAASGSRTLSPSVSTVFILIAYDPDNINPGPVATLQITVTVAQVSLSVDSFSATFLESQGDLDSYFLRWQTTGANRVRLLAITSGGDIEDQLNQDSPVDQSGFHVDFFNNDRGCFIRAYDADNNYVQSATVNF